MSTLRPRISTAGRIANLSRRLDPDHPLIVEARQDLGEHAIVEAIEAAPPLRPEQIDRLLTVLESACAGRATREVII